jgi:hypothetical protein
VNTEATLDQQTLQEQLAESRELLAALARTLRATDQQLEALSTERQQYQLLQDACEALEKLGEMDAAQLFWGERLSGEPSIEHLRRVRTKVAGFQQRWDEIEARRQATIAEMSQHQEGLEILEEDLFQAQQQEERRKLEWIVEREISALPARQAVMPWARGGEDDRRFRKALGASLLVSLLLGLLLLGRLLLGRRLLLRCLQIGYLLGGKIDLCCQTLQLLAALNHPALLFARALDPEPVGTQPDTLRGYH